VGADVRPAAVATPSNFGHLGEPPTHPELLDDLAVRFVESRLVAQVAAARDGDVGGVPAGFDRGVNRMPQGPIPENAFMANEPQAARRGAWRDAVLAAAGRLEPAIGGPSIDPQDPDGDAPHDLQRASRLELNGCCRCSTIPIRTPTATAASDHHAAAKAVRAEQPLDGPPGRRAGRRLRIEREAAADEAARSD
jgi:hypothetical protein